MGLPAGMSNNITLGHIHLYHPASVDVLYSPVHCNPVRALERALSVAHGKAHYVADTLTLQITAAVFRAQHGWLKHFTAGARSVVFTFL